MNIVPWKDVNDDASERTMKRREGEGEAVVVANNGKTVIKKPPTSIPSSSSSSSWMKSKDPRIVRVSRAFGGKDRHSKVCTLRGLRDRRVRLSVPTAIQLYDLQERLGLDQPSKAVDWLLEAAKEEIDELPPLPISPENFSHFNHHQSFLNLGQKTGQDPTQIGFKINRCVEESREENNKEKRENDVVFSNNHHIGSYGTYHDMEHHHHHQQQPNVQSNYHHHHHHHHHQQQPNVQSNYHHHHQHQLHSLVPFPLTTTTTIQSLFPSSSSSMETIDPRQMVSHFHMPLMGNSSSSSSQNISSLYSLLHGTSSSNNGGRANTTRTSRGSDHHL